MELQSLLVLLKHYRKPLVFVQILLEKNNNYASNVGILLITVSNPKKYVTINFNVCLALVEKWIQSIFPKMCSLKRILRHNQYSNTTIL
jgi:hypothetical protein